MKGEKRQKQVNRKDKGRGVEKGEKWKERVIGN